MKKVINRKAYIKPEVQVHGKVGEVTLAVSETGNPDYNHNCDPLHHS